LIAEKATTLEQEYKATFTATYSPGVLKAVAVENDKEIESTILQTSGDGAKIKLTADRKEIAADGQDLCYVTIEITDRDGVFQPDAANRLHFNLEGPGVIAGIDNADLRDYDQYAGNTRKAWHGRALVVIRSTHGIGDIKCTVTSPGLLEAALNIKTILPPVK
jgi:beta-galactosidase